MSKQIKSIAELKREASKQSGLDGFILLAGGLMRSSKQIYYDTVSKVFEIWNDIDGTTLTVSEAELKTETNIIEALKKGCLYKY